jgi:hypothetical protein
MSKVILSSLGILLYIAPCSAQQKTDVQGFFPGMNEQRFIVSLKNADIACEGETERFFNGRSKEMPFGSTVMYCFGPANPPISKFSDSDRRLELQELEMLKRGFSRKAYEIANLQRRKNAAEFEFSFFATKYLSPNVVWKIKYTYTSFKAKEDMIALMSSTYKKEPTRPNTRCQEDGFARPDAFWNLSGTLSLLVVRADFLKLQNNEYIPFYVVVLCDETLPANDEEAMKSEIKERGRREPSTRF